MVNLVLEWLRGIPKELIVVIMGILPISEVRGAIPLALYYGMPYAKAFWLAVLGNSIFIIPALFLLEPATNWLRRFRPFERFFSWQHARTQKKAELIQRYEFWGLLVFVAIPLPMTGAWSGAIAASLFKVRFRYAFVAILAGVFCAALIVLSLCAMGMLSWKAVAH